MTATAPLQQQIDAFRARGKELLPATLIRDLVSPIERLKRSRTVDKAIQEGDPAPTFTLPDAYGASVRLSDLLVRGPVVLTFYRGAWCPYCNLQLRAYQAALPQMEDLGASLVAISPQTPDHSLVTAEKDALTFPVLSDVGNVVARRYGLVFAIDEPVRAAHIRVGADLPAYNGDDTWELPMAGSFIVDRAGIVRLSFVDPDFMRRLEPSTIVARLAEIRD